MLLGEDKRMNECPHALRPLFAALLLLAGATNAAGYSNDAFECYVAVYSELGERPTLVNPALGLVFTLKVPTR